MIYALFILFVVAVCTGLAIGVLWEAIDRWSDREVDRMVDEGLAAIREDDRAADIAADTWTRYEAERRLLDWQAHCESAFDQAMRPTPRPESTPMHDDLLAEKLRADLDADDAVARIVGWGAVSAERFWAKVDKSGDCWMWSSHKGRNGYGYYRTTDRNRLAHRVAYELVKGPIPDGLHLDHLCRTRACVNPSHLEAVTPGENVRRGEPANRTHCPQGHAYAPDNTSVRDGKRHCRACHRVHQANYLARKKVS